MPTTFGVFYLGNNGVFIDTVEGNQTSENHGAFNNTSWGSAGDPLAQNLRTFSPDPVQGPEADGDATSYGADNNAANERFFVDGSGPLTHDATMLYNNTVIRYTDGSTVTVNSIVMQDTSGNLYLLPPTTTNAYSDALEAKPIESVTLGTAAPSGGTTVYGMTANRYDLTVSDYVVEGTGGNDLIDASFIGDPEGDRIDDTDNLAGDNNDSVLAGAGNDTVLAGAGDDTVYGENGNDSLLGGAGDDQILGGVGDDRVFGGDGNDTLYGDGQSDPGVWDYQVWNYDFSSANGQAFDAESGTLAGTGTTPDFSSAALVDDARGTTGDPDDFAVVYTSTLVASETGAFTFSTTSDDGSTIRILDANGNPLTWTNQDGSTASFMDNDYHQGATTRTGQVTLQEGVSYTIEVRHWENAGGEVISGTVTSPGGTTEDLANSAMIQGPEASGAGNDLIEGGAGDDLIYGGLGDDTLAGNDGADQLFGGDGRDVFLGSTGDLVDGGEGGDDFDTLDLSGSSLPGGSLTVNYDDLNPENGQVVYRDASGTIVDTLDFSNIENVVPCFAAGTLIKTLAGELPADEILPGDMVLTRDAGYQPVRWVGARSLSAAQLCARPDLQPVTITAGALGKSQPERDLIVSPQHRMLVCHPQTQLWFGADEVLAAAVHLTCLDGVAQRVPQDGVTYVHLMFDDHQIINGDGAWSESFQPGRQTLDGMDAAQRDEIFSLFPELRGTTAERAYPAARATLKAYEARVLAL